jgi:predicted DNA-binding protein with PD1-like motif
MKTCLFIFFMAYTALAIAQDKFPDVYAVESEFERVEIIRLQNGTDMLEGLNQAIKEKNIINGIFLTGIGSVTDYRFHVVSSRELPPSNEMTEASAPMDLVSFQGYIFDERVHAHISLADENSMVGGHLESGTKVLTFIIVTVGVLPDELSIKSLDKY